MEEQIRLLERENKELRLTIKLLQQKIVRERDEWVMPADTLEATPPDAWGR